VEDPIVGVEGDYRGTLDDYSFFHIVQNRQRLYFISPPWDRRAPARRVVECGEGGWDYGCKEGVGISFRRREAAAPSASTEEDEKK
jgi:hypothetical protein